MPLWLLKKGSSGDEVANKYLSASTGALVAFLVCLSVQFAWQQSDFDSIQKRLMGLEATRTDAVYISDKDKVWRSVISALADADENAEIYDTSSIANEDEYEDLIGQMVNSGNKTYRIACESNNENVVQVCIADSMKQFYRNGQFPDQLKVKHLPTNLAIDIFALRENEKSDVWLGLRANDEEASYQASVRVLNDKMQNDFRQIHMGVLMKEAHDILSSAENGSCTWCQKFRERIEQ